MRLLFRNLFKGIWNVEVGYGMRNECGDGQIYELDKVLATFWAQITIVGVHSGVTLGSL